MVPQGWGLEYLYVGTSDIQATLSTYLASPGARKLWHFKHGDHELAGVRLGEGPTYIVAAHQPAGTCIPFFSVPHLDATAAQLADHGWQPQGEPFGIPPGPARMIEDPTGNRFGIFENVTPEALQVAYHDHKNPWAVRE